jgi:release factor glutamine methyltransferase
MSAGVRAGEKPTTVRELIQVASGWLAEQGLDEARLDTECLLARVLGCRRLDLYLDHDRPLSGEELSSFRALMRRRAGREPLAYILGTRGFHGLELAVGPGVLVPRPETEHLVEVGLEVLSERPDPRFADVGTGSGCVALALLAEHTGARGVASDVSPQALAIAAKNAQTLGLRARLDLVRADLLAHLTPRSLDLVVSNPPYVTPGEEDLLAPEVRDHEPQQALFDADGLPLTRRLAEQAFGALRPGGTLAIETGWNKAPLVRQLLEEAGFSELRAIADLSGIDRVIVGRAPV